MEMKCLLTAFFPQIYLKIASALLISKGCWSCIATQATAASVDLATLSRASGRR